MSPLIIDAAGMVLILKNLASDMKEHSEELRELDAQIGDGDLGVTIELASKALSEYLTSTDEKDIGNLLMQTGMSINRANPSTFATLLASAFMGGGKAVMGKTSIEPMELALIGERAVENIQKRGKAEVGGKTLLDTVIPAVNTFKKEIQSGTGIADAIAATVKTAEEGMNATINMKAKFGRARWFQDSSIGIKDAGATAMYYMIKAFAESLGPEILKE